MVPPLIGTSKSIEAIKEQIEHAANTCLNVIITGESGVGKEVVAQNIYHESQRKDKPFIKVHCAALSDGVIGSELFGFKQDTLTNTDGNKSGKFDLTHQGVIFLDEIGEMPHSFQSKLLNVFESGKFTPLSSKSDITSDVWVIAATNQEIEKKVKEGSFREDLYFRLNTIKIDIPPLRNRPEDVLPLIDYFIEKYNSQLDGRKISKPNSYAMKKLITYSWPENVRELQNIIKSFMVMGSWEKIIDILNLKSRSVAIVRSEEQVLEGSSIVDIILDFKGDFSSDHASFPLKKITKKATEKIEKEVISFVLDKTNWNRTKASKILNLSYKALLYKINNLDIKLSTPND